MGSDQSSQLPAGAPGSRIKSQRDEDIPYTSYSISKPISGGEFMSILLSPTESRGFSFPMSVQPHVCSTSCLSLFASTIFVQSHK